MAIQRDTFPLPDTTDPLTAPFFAAAAEHELRISRCMACDRFVWYPTERCVRCDRALEWQRVSGQATLFSWAVVQRAFLPAFETLVPFVTALVVLDEDPAVRLCTYLVDAAPETLRAEEPVVVAFRPLQFATVPGHAVTVPMFRRATP